MSCYETKWRVEDEMYYRRRASLLGKARQHEGDLNEEDGNNIAGAPSRSNQSIYDMYRKVNQGEASRSGPRVVSPSGSKDDLMCRGGPQELSTF